MQDLLKMANSSKLKVQAKTSHFSVTHICFRSLDSPRVIYRGLQWKAAQYCRLYILIFNFNCRHTSYLSFPA